MSSPPCLCTNAPWCVSPDAQGFAGSLCTETPSAPPLDPPAPSIPPPSVTARSLVCSCHIRVWLRVSRVASCPPCGFVSPRVASCPPACGAGCVRRLGDEWTHSAWWSPVGVAPGSCFWHQEACWASTEGHCVSSGTAGPGEHGHRAAWGVPPLGAPDSPVPCVSSSGRCCSSALWVCGGLCAVTAA